ncbi:TPA: DUF1367 family protein [Aeromonas veronii]
MELTLLKMSGGVLVPSTPADAEAIRSLPIGSFIQAKGSGRRNPAFHRRFFALLNAWPLNMIALEIHGGIHSGGRHTRGKGFVEDRVKMNEAALLGWSVIEVTPEHIKTGQLRAWLLKAFDRNTNHLRTTP